MDSLSIDNLNALIGDLASAQKSQQQTLLGVQRIINESLKSLSSSIKLFGSHVERLVNDKLAIKDRKEIKQPPQQPSNNKQESAVLERGQKERINEIEKHGNSLLSGFKSISSSFLSREQNKSTDKIPEKKEKKAEIAPVTEESKQLKQTNKELIALNTKMAALIKDVKSSNKPEAMRSSLMKILGPHILLLGGIASLSYGLLKFPKIKSFFTDLSKGKIGLSITSLIKKIKPNDKSILEWLRGLPLIGRMFSIYDAIKSFSEGDYKTGLKHLAFFIPGSEFFISILGGGISKQEFLKPGGIKQLSKGLTLKSFHEQVIKKFESIFVSFSDFFNKVKESMMPMLDGTWSGINTGLDSLSYYFPVVRPVADFLSGMTDDLFGSSLADSARAKKVDGTQVTLVDIAKEVIDKIYTGISKFFNIVVDLIGQAGSIIGSIGGVFSSDYTEQVRALSVIDKFAPGVSGALRSMMDIFDTINKAGVTDTDSILSIAYKLNKTPNVGRYQRRNTEPMMRGLRMEDAKKKVETTKEGSKEREQAEYELEIERAKIVIDSSKDLYLRKTEDLYNQIDSIKTAAGVTPDAPFLPLLIEDQVREIEKKIKEEEKRFAEENKKNYKRLKDLEEEKEKSNINTHIHTDPTANNKKQGVQTVPNQAGIATGSNNAGQIADIHRQNKLNPILDINSPYTPTFNLQPDRNQQSSLNPSLDADTSFKQHLERQNLIDTESAKTLIQINDKSSEQNSLLSQVLEHLKKHTELLFDVRNISANGKQDTSNNIAVINKGSSNATSAGRNPSTFIGRKAFGVI